jgi:hypothetical protein
LLKQRENYMTSVPLVYSFWFMLVAYVVHIIDESLLGGSFVEKVREHWWPKYSWRKFFWFNTGYLLLMFASILLYDRIGRAALWLPPGLGHRKVLQCRLACLVVQSLPGVFARAPNQLIDLDADLLHSRL